ncbi:MAG: DUF488 domain-containing protein [Deltaproteobacteria bacterium]|nr:DUF488 domain-containing protein [Deltaproteobacteria bacterium]
MMKPTRLFTIGFTKKPAEAFFTRLSEAGVKRVIDTRLNNVSQLAGFAKRDDLRYFLKALCEIEYIHLPELAPTQEIMDNFKKKQGDWTAYEKAFNALLKERKPENTLSRDLVDHACLLCSEDRPDHCHRRLVAKYLSDRWGDMEIVHL